MITIMPSWSRDSIGQVSMDMHRIDTNGSRAVIALMEQLRLPSRIWDGQSSPPGTLAIIPSVPFSSHQSCIIRSGKSAEEQTLWFSLLEVMMGWDFVEISDVFTSPALLSLAPILLRQ